MISVVLTTHNEEKNIARCLDSVVSFANEIIIADGESTDRTKEIAIARGAKIIETTNKSNFHINKQIAMDAASGDLVLQLDADEVLDQEMQAFIQKLESDRSNGVLPEQPVAWYLRRKNYFLGTFLTKGGQYPDPVIRLYKKNMAKLPQKNVHEQMSVDGESGTAGGHLLHYAFPQFDMYMNKFNRYTSFEAKRLLLQNIKPSTSMKFEYWIKKPIITFFSLFLRHKGFVDGFPGFVYSLMSSLHHPFTYLKLEEEFKKS